MKKFYTFSMLVLISLNCSAKDHQINKDLSALSDCSASSKQSGDADLYWKMAQDPTASGSLDDICKVATLALKPTQFAVGLYEVKAKSDDLKNLNSQKLDKYLQKNPEPIVVGPHGELFIIDHHHLARALSDSKIDNTYGIILENWNGTSEGKFWQHMKDKQWYYLINENGEKKTIADLMKVNTVKDLKDDPYRSLAGETRCKVQAKCTDGQWLKEPIPFIEFLWAEHFRKTPAVASALKNYGDKDFKKVIDAASNEVKSLKGVLPDNEAHFNN